MPMPKKASQIVAENRTQLKHVKYMYLGINIIIKPKEMASQ